MKKSTILLSIAACIALPAWAADPSEDVKSAAKKLSEKSYSWSSKTESPRTGDGGGQGGGRGRGFGFGSSSLSGKVDKDGFAIVTYTFGENSSDAVIKGDKYAIKTGDEWKTGEELRADADAGGGQGGRGRFMGGIVGRTRIPATEAQELVGKTKELKKDSDAYTGELNAEAVKQANGFRRGGGGDGPDTSGIKGTVKFWVKDGTLSKYETKYTGKMNLPGRDGGDSRSIDINRTTTVEIKDVGTTKVEVPAEAKKKLKS